MSRPVVSEAAERLYDRLRPYEDGVDEDNGWTLLLLCDALALITQRVQDVLRYDDAGSGIRRLFDPLRTPAWALPWLAGVAGCVIPAGASEAQIRALIADNPYRRRGRPDAISAAAAATLTGMQRVTLVERYLDDPDQILVITYTGETPDPAVTLAATKAAKPIGLLLTQRVDPDWDYGQAQAAYATYGDAEAAYATYGDAETVLPTP